MPPGPIDHQDATATSTSVPIKAEGKGQVNTEQAFGSADEALRHSFLLRNHADTPQLIDNLDNLASQHNCEDGPLHTIAILPLVEDVMAAE